MVLINEDINQSINQTPQGKEPVEPGAPQNRNNLKFHKKRGKFRSANSVLNNQKTEMGGAQAKATNPACYVCGSLTHKLKNCHMLDNNKSVQANFLNRHLWNTISKTKICGTDVCGRNFSVSPTRFRLSPDIARFEHNSARRIKNDGELFKNSRRYGMSNASTHSLSRNSFSFVRLRQSFCGNRGRCSQ